MKAGVTFLLFLLLALPALAQDGLGTAEGRFEAGAYGEAVRLLEAKLAHSPQDGRARYWLGRAYLELGELDRAVAALEQATRLQANSEHSYWLGRAYGRKASRERSLSLARRSKGAFEQAVRLDPSNIAARRALADYLVQAPWIAGGSDAKASEQCHAVARLDPVQGHLCWGEYWVADGEPGKAEVEFRAALDAAPPRPEPYFEVAAFYRQRGDATNMERAVEAAAWVSPKDPMLSYYRGVVRILAGNRLDEAERLLKDYLRVPPRTGRPTHAGTHEWLGRLYEKLERNQEAIEHYRASLQLDPNRRSVRQALERLEKNN